MNRGSPDESHSPADPAAPGPRPPRLRDRWKADARLAILAAAEATFAAEGLEHARMEQIAAGAGVAVGTLYNYFPSRQALIDALVDANRQELATRLDQLHLAADGPLPQQLQEFLGVLATHLQGHRAFFGLLLQADVLPGRSQGLRVLLERAERLLEPAETVGLLAPAPAGMHAAMLIGLLRAAFGREVLGSHCTPPQELVEHVIRVFLHGSLGNPEAS
jgi:AcrR family transcriptional regulator